MELRFLLKLPHLVIAYFYVPFFENGSLGRLSSDFPKRSKRRKTELLFSNYTPESLDYSAQMTLRASGKKGASKLIKDVTFTSSSRASKYRKSFS